MARKPCTFSETDVKRFVRAVTAAGLEVHGVNLSLDRKEITVLTDKTAVTITSNMKANELDRELEEFQKRHGQG